MRTEHLKDIWSRTIVLIHQYQRVLDQYLETQKEEYAARLNGIRILINNVFSQALCIVGIDFTGINWSRFELKMMEIQSISYLGLHIKNSSKSEYDKDVDLLFEEYIDYICELMIDGS